MDENPKTDPPPRRESLNRVAGLSCYAGGALVLAFTIWNVIDTWRQHGIDGVKQDIQSIAIIGGFGLILLAIGFTTGRKPKS